MCAICSTSPKVLSATPPHPYPAVAGLTPEQYDLYEDTFDEIHYSLSEAYTELRTGFCPSAVNPLTDLMQYIKELPLAILRDEALRNEVARIFAEFMDEMHNNFDLWSQENIAQAAAMQQLEELYLDAWSALDEASRTNPLWVGPSLSTEEDLEAMERIRNC